MVMRKRIWHLLSQTVNAVVLGADPDETISARAHREGWAHKIDAWLGKGHCERVWQEQKEREQARQSRSVI